MGNNPDKSEHWVDDSLVASCPVCYQPFTALRRRHHCRKCGRIYCAEHLPYKSVIEVHGVEKEEKICKECYFAKPIYHREPSSESDSEDTKRQKFQQQMRASNQEKKAKEEKKKKKREALEQKTFKQFIQAIQAGDLSEMELILSECIIDCNYSDDTGTAMTYAMTSPNRLEVLRYLIGKGVKLEKAYNSLKPIHLAILDGSYDTVKLLIQEGHVNLNSHYQFKTTLHMATERNLIKLAELLLENGAINDPEALALALKENYLDIAKLCLRWGAKEWPQEYNDLVKQLKKEIAAEP